MKSPRRARRNPKPSISERCRRGLRKHSAARRSRVNTKKFESAETKAITSSKPLLRIPSGKALQFSQPLHLYCARRSFISGGPNFAERSHRCVYGLLLSVSKNTHTKPRNAGTAEIPSLSPDLRSKGELLCRPPLDCTDLRPTLYRSTVILSGEQGLARFFR